MAVRTSGSGHTTVGPYPQFCSVCQADIRTRHARRSVVDKAGLVDLFMYPPDGPQRFERPGLQSDALLDLASGQLICQVFKKLFILPETASPQHDRHR